ncbi:MAG TPA: beta-galactosidase [Vicinamibacterales bacterium]|nr:beta-galactosidase [Vicinamibacterales bacterium]
MRTLTFAIAVLLIWTAPAPEPFMPIGVWYGGGSVRAPMMPRDSAAHRDEWRRDLRTIRSLGFNSIKTWVDWASTEPKPGEYRFEAFDQLMTLADETGLRVIVQFYTDSAPEWIGRSFPDAAFVSEQGTLVRSQAAPGYCIDHPRVRAAMSAFIAAASARARRHPSLYGFDVWSEPHIVNWVWFSTPAEFCYCPYTQARFRDWLRRKYQSLDALNAGWYRSFDTWAQVEAPRYGTILSYTDFMDWKTFIAEKLRGDLKTKADATGARGAIPISSHSDAPAVLLSPLSGFGNPDDWWMTQAVDHYGTSIYPRHASSAAPWSAVRLMSALDGIRSAARDQGWWIGELQAGQGATGVRVGTPVTAADVRLWGWAALSRGAGAISYYAYYPMSSGYESNGYGLIELNGTVTDRAKAAGRFAADVNREAALFTRVRPRPAPVAVLYNRLSYMVGGNTVGPGATVRNSMIGFYRAMFERNIAVDFLHVDEIASRASSYRVIYLGTPLMLPRAAAAALKEYVRGGGVLISEARPAWNDDRGFANQTIPGAGLDEVFGVRETELRSPESVVMTDDTGASIPGAGFEEHVEAIRDGVRAIARFSGGAAAITSATFGRGRAVLIGSFPAAAFEIDPVKARPAGALLQRLVEDAGVHPEIAIDTAPGGVEARVLSDGEHHALVAINHEDTPHAVTLRLADELPRAGWTRLEGGAAEFDGPSLRWDARPRDVLVLLRR